MPSKIDKHQHTDRDATAKKCRWCGQLKSLECFVKHNDSMNGRQNRCKACKNRMDRSTKRYRLTNSNI